MSHDSHERERAERVERAQLSLPLAELEGSPLAAYRESDDAPTSFFETPHPPPSWLVQITPFDRRVMSRDALLHALQGTRIVGGQTLVWRQGMKNWRAIAELEELGRHVPPAAAPVRRSSIAAWCGASALATLAGTLLVLSAAGVFQSPAPALSGSAALQEDTVPEGTARGSADGTAADGAASGRAAQLGAALAASLPAAPLEAPLFEATGLEATEQVVSAITPAPAPAHGGAGEQVEHRHEQRTAEDRPQDREGPAVDIDRQQLRQVQVARQQHAKQRANKSNHHRDQKAAARSPAQRTANRAADARDDQQQQ